MKKRLCHCVNEDMEELKVSYIACGKVIWYSHLGKHIRSFRKH